MKRLESRNGEKTSSFHLLQAGGLQSQPIDGADAIGACQDVSNSGLGFEPLRASGYVDQKIGDIGKVKLNREGATRLQARHLPPPGSPGKKIASLEVRNFDVTLSQ